MAVFEHADRSDNFHKIARESAVSVEDFATEPVRALFSWWQSFGCTAPQYSDFDVSDHWKIAPHLYVIQYLAPGKYLYRLNGEQVVEIIGVSKRGQKITRKDSLLENRLLAEYMDFLVEDNACRRCYGTLALFGKNYLEFESVDCPVTNSQGDIEFIIGAISTLD